MSKDFVLFIKFLQYFYVEMTAYRIPLAQEVNNQNGGDESREASYQYFPS